MGSEDLFGGVVGRNQSQSDRREEHEGASTSFYRQGLRLLLLPSMNPSLPSYTSKPLLDSSPLP